MWMSLNLLRVSPNEDPYRLLTCSGNHQGVSHYRLAPSIPCGRASIFQKTPRRVAVRVNIRIGYWPARAAIRAYLIVVWLWVSNVVSLHLSGNSPKSRHQGEDPYRLWICSGDHQGISHYRLALRGQCGRVSIFQETPWRLTIRVRTRIGCGSARVAIRVYPIID